MFPFKCGWEGGCLDGRLPAGRTDTVITFAIIIFQPKTNGHCGEETSECQIFCSVWRKTSEPASRDGY